MFKSITQFFQKFRKSEKEESKSTAKERLHLVLAQDRANISADFLEMMKQEILEVIKKYIDIDEKAIDVRLTNKEGEDGKIGAPALYANLPIITIRNEARKLEGTLKKENNNEIKDENNNKVDENTEPENIKENEQEQTNKEENSESKNNEPEKKVKNDETNIVDSTPKVEPKKTIKTKKTQKIKRG